MENGIYKAIADVLSEVGAVGKDGQNTFDKYRYRSIDAVMNAMHPAMAKHRVFVIPEVLEQSREERGAKSGGVLIYSIIKVRYTFYAEDGSSLTATVIGEGMDKGDKSVNKAMSAAFKYALFQVFCIPTDEFSDSEDESPEARQKPKNKIDEYAKREAQKAGSNAKKQIDDAAAYKKKLLDKLKKIYKPESLEKLASNYKKEKIDDLSADELESIVNSIMSKIEEKEKNGSEGTNTCHKAVIPEQKNTDHGAARG